MANQSKPPPLKSAKLSRIGHPLGLPQLLMSRGRRRGEGERGRPGEGAGEAARSGGTSVFGRRDTENMGL